MAARARQTSAIRERAAVKSALLEALREASGAVQARDAAVLVAQKLGVTDAERALPRSSGKPTKWENEVQWAYQDLKREHRAFAHRAGVWSATE